MNRWIRAASANRMVLIAGVVLGAAITGGPALAVTELGDGHHAGESQDSEGHAGESRDSDEDGQARDQDGDGDNADEPAPNQTPPPAVPSAIPAPTPPR